MFGFDHFDDGNSSCSGDKVDDENTVKETVQALVLFRGQQRLTLLEHVPGRGYVRVDGAQLAGLVGETDQVLVDMVPGGAVTSQGLVEGPQHLHGHQSHLSVVGHRQLLTKCQGQCLRLTLRSYKSSENLKCQEHHGV